MLTLLQTLDRRRLDLSIMKKGKGRLLCIWKLYSFNITFLRIQNFSEATKFSPTITFFQVQCNFLLSERGVGKLFCSPLKIVSVALKFIRQNLFSQFKVLSENRKDYDFSSRLQKLQVSKLCFLFWICAEVESFIWKFILD